MTLPPALTRVPRAVCPSCNRREGIERVEHDLGVLYRCSRDDCTYEHFLAWTDTRVDPTQGHAA